MMQIKNRLAVLMAEKGIRSVSELQRQLKQHDLSVSRRTLDKFHKNESSRVEWETLAALCAALDCTPGDLLYLDEKGDE